MRRPLRWYWVLLLSLAVYSASAVGVLFLVYGFGHGEPRGALLEPVRRLYDQFVVLTDEDLAAYLWVLVLALPPALLATVVCLWLRRGMQRDDGYLHCLKCGYILKGIAEPPCPECGERI